MLYSLLIVDYSNTRVAHTGRRYDAGINTFDTANVGQLNELLFPSIHIFQSFRCTPMASQK
jgi:hypothetical protein